MKHPNIWLAASALTVAACTSTQTAPDAPAIVAVASADQIAGRDVYSQYCSACHDGGDETAPELDELHGLGRDRITAALAPGGLMALQSGMINAQQRAHVIAFLVSAAGGRAPVRQCGPQHRPHRAQP